MNVFTFTGNLGRDCERKTTGSGLTLCEFSVGITTGYGDKAKTTWAKCSLFGKKAEGKLPEYLVKGQKVCVSGEMSLDEWEKDGQKYSALKVNVNSIDLIGNISPQQVSNKPAKPINPHKVIHSAADLAAENFESDLPF